MNSLEIEMVEILKKLKKKYGVTDIKAEFEAEASRIEEVMRLKDITDKAGLGMILKIGGAEAITDMFEAQHIGVSGLIAPMIESPYAMSKFITAVNNYFPKDARKKIIFGVNIETKIAHDKLSDILNVKGMEIIDKITVGRVDLSGSLGIDRDSINCDEIYKITEEIFRQSKRKNKVTTMGGGIAVEALPFIKKLARLRLIDFFETRKVVFKTPGNFSKAGDGIVLANTFELMWLQNKKDYYQRVFLEDDRRIMMLKKRIGMKKK